MPDPSSLFGSADKQPQKPPEPGHHGRGRWFIPLLIVVLLVTVVAVTWERWLPPTEVEVVRVIAQQADPQQLAKTGTDTVAFQAAGWVEADPHPIRVTALTSGVLTEVLVREGEAIEPGQVLAKLDPRDAGLAVEAAAADLATAEARIVTAEAETAQAEARAAQAVAAIAAAEARLADAEDAAARLDRVGAGVVSERTRRAAALQVERVAAELATAKAAAAAAKSAVPAAAARVDAARKARQRAAVAVATAKLALERCAITAPVAGVIQRLHKVPGDKVMLDMDNPTSASVLDCFDPTKLRVRVDVALADAGGLSVGQRAKLTCPVAPDEVFTGVVKQIEGQADITRNTLQAKVAIDDPQGLLRPEMLCRVQFLATAGTGATTPDDATASRLQLFLPRDTFGGRSGETVEAWIVGPDGRAAKATVTLGPIDGEEIVVTAGLAAGALVIVDPPAGLAEGDRVSYGDQP